MRRRTPPTAKNIDGVEFAGMIGVTLFGLILTPAVYVVVRRMAIGHDAGRLPLALPEPHA